MNLAKFDIYENKIILHFDSRVCETPEELLSSNIFQEVLTRCIKELSRRNSMLLNIFDKRDIKEKDIAVLINTFQFLTKMPGKLIPKVVKGSEVFFRDPHLFNEFVEFVYNHWRGYERFIICEASPKSNDKKTFRDFNDTIEQLSNLVRRVYRDLQENITNDYPRIYRQVIAGAEVAAIATSKKVNFPASYNSGLADIPLIRQILLYPPLILNPPMNKRTGRFERISQNPLQNLKINKEEWIGYPAMVGPLLIMIYFHKKFYELGFSLCNLFKLADDEELTRTPDAVYMFGVPGQELDGLASFPTVFFDDQAHNMLVAAVPNRDEFGYFGYLKKMVLTLHNIKMMKSGRLPFHGALVQITLKGNKTATILFIGDTGAGKSETLETFRELGEELIQDINIIADDMGSLEMDAAGNIIGYGTEIGAFLRLDDLQPGYALGQIDRAIIMSANQVNARIILPVTTYENLIKGYKIDYILYANNYEGIDEDHPIIERFSDPQQAMMVFKEGAVMSKGTTTSSGIVHSYYANVFGPPQYKELHEPLAKKFFEAFFQRGVVVGQMRTRLGLSGWERKGPEEAARELLKSIQ